MRPSSSCICKHINTIETKTRFTILMHPKEYKREKIGTGRMTQLQLENSEIIVGIDFTNNKRVNEILSKEENSHFLLYPGKDNFNLSERKSSEIIFSTIESVYTVLNLLKEVDLEQCDTKDFLIPFEKMIEHQVECFLNPNKKSYRSNRNMEIIPKNVYQKNTKRSIIFKPER